MTDEVRSRGRWALITGASAGIGAAFADELANRGWNLILSARREERLRDLANRKCAGDGIEAVVVPADLSEPVAGTRLWNEAASERSIDLLINNAGFGLHDRFDELSLDRQLEMVQLNCGAVLELAHHALRSMRPRHGGGIINVASTAAFQPIPTMATYAATKAFVLSLSQALWEENRRSGVRVLALCPGPVPTEFQEVAGTRVSPKTLGYQTPEQVARAALDALQSEKSYAVPGATNHLGALLARAAPLPLATRAARKVIERWR